MLSFFFIITMGAYNVFYCEKLFKAFANLNFFISKTVVIVSVFTWFIMMIWVFQKFLLDSDEIQAPDALKDITTKVSEYEKYLGLIVIYFAIYFPALIMLYAHLTFSENSSEEFSCKQFHNRVFCRNSKAFKGVSKISIVILSCTDIVSDIIYVSTATF